MTENHTRLATEIEDAAPGLLLPCPFCGETPVVRSDPDVTISCVGCRQSKVEAAWYGGDMGVTVAYWNKRKPQSIWG